MLKCFQQSSVRATRWNCKLIYSSPSGSPLRLYNTSFLRNFSLMRDLENTEMTCSNKMSLDRYNLGVTEVLAFSGSPISAFQEAQSLDPTNIMALIAEAMVLFLSLEKTREDIHLISLLEKVNRFVLEGKITERERACAFALECYANGRWRLATRVLETQLLKNPVDALLVLFLHHTYFFLGESTRMSQSVERILSSYPPGPYKSFLHGMYAFGKEESSSRHETEYTESIEHCSLALNDTPGDPWSIHALAHVYEMRGDVEEGLAMIKETEYLWEQSPHFSRHIVWHWCLLFLQSGAKGYRRCLGLCDSMLLAPGRVDALSLDDACSLLWRLELMHPRCLDSIRQSQLGELVEPKIEIPRTDEGEEQDPGVPASGSKGSFWSMLMGTPEKEVSLDLYPSPKAHAPSHGSMMWETAAERWIALGEATSGARLASFHDIHIAMALAFLGPQVSAAAATTSFLNALNTAAEKFVREGPSGDWLSQYRQMHYPSLSDSEVIDLFVSSELSSSTDHQLNDNSKIDNLNLELDLPFSLFQSKKKGFQFSTRGSSTSEETSVDQLVQVFRKNAFDDLLSSNGRERFPLPSSVYINDAEAVNFLVGRHISAAVVLFKRGEFERSFQLLKNSRNSWPRIGGSIAQRDVLDQTLIMSAIAAGRFDDAVELLEERLEFRPSCSLTMYLLGSVYILRNQSGDVARGLELRGRAYVAGLNQGPNH